jgi:hypothetical protein
MRKKDDQPFISESSNSSIKPHFHLKLKYQLEIKKKQKRKEQQSM